MSGDISGAETPADNHSVATATTTVKKKFQNGWTKELETMIADWADKAACYRWMHEETSRRFSGYDRSITLPVIILSTVTGTANFALDGFFDPDSQYKKYAQSAIGGLSILAGIITTIGTKLAYATSAEAHRVAGVSWGKFNRNLCIEMNLNPDERMDSINFLKMFRIELDRLIDQSPTIPKPVIKEFNRIFKSTTNVIKPEITGILNHTKVFEDKGARLKRVAAEATIALYYKKGILKQMVMDSLEEKTRAAAIESARRVATELIEREKETVRAAAAAALAAKAEISKKPVAPKPLVERQKQERELELKKIATAKAGTVAALKEKFRRQSVTFSGVPPVSSSPLPGAIPVEEPIQNVVVQLDETQREPVEQQPVTEEAKPADVAITVEDVVQEEAKPSVDVESESEDDEENEGDEEEEKKTEEPPKKGGWLNIF